MTDSKSKLFLLSDDEISDKVIQVITSKFKMNSNDITSDKDLQNDLGADSLDLVELMITMEQEFDCEISDERAAKIKTVNDIIQTLIKYKNNEQDDE